MPIDALGNICQLQVVDVHMRTYQRTLELPIKVPQHCIASHCQEHYTSCAANGRNVARHRDNNTVYLHCYALTSVASVRLSAHKIHLSDVLRRQVDLSVASKVLKPFANYVTAIINHTASTVWRCKNIQERFIIARRDSEYICGKDTTTL